MAHLTKVKVNLYNHVWSLSLLSVHKGPDKSFTEVYQNISNQKVLPRGYPSPGYGGGGAPQSWLGVPLSWGYPLAGPVTDLGSPPRRDVGTETLGPPKKGPGTRVCGKDWEHDWGNPQKGHGTRGWEGTWDQRLKI